MSDSHSQEAARTGTPRNETTAYRLVERMKSGEAFAISGVEYTELHPDGVGALFEDGSFLIEVRDESPELITAGDRYRRIWLVGNVVDGHATWQRLGARADQAKS